jgi:DNA polymerase-3 subunit alpha
MSKDFVHLRVHTEFSLIDSIVRIKPLVTEVAKMGMPAVAVTDQCNFYGLIKFYGAARGAGVKPIGGADFWLRDSDGKVSLITLLAMNRQGYKNIIQIISKAHQEGQYASRMLYQ